MKINYKYGYLFNFNFFEERIMLNDIFWDKSPCDDIGLKSFLQVVSCENDFKNKSVFEKGIQYWGYVSLICILGVKEFRYWCV